jgi:hypothetical protein
MRRAHIEDGLGNARPIRLAALEQLAALVRHGFEEGLSVRPVLDLVRPANVLGPNAREELGDVVGRRGQVLDADNALKHLGRFRLVGRGGHDARAVNEVDAAHEGDVLPDLCAGSPREPKRLVWQRTLVSPGMGATVQTFFCLSVLMMLLLPTLG